MTDDQQIQKPGSEQPQKPGSEQPQKPGSDEQEKPRDGLSLFMPQADPQLSKPVMAAFSAILIFLGMGTVVYHALEKWSWIECLYFSTYSLTTVGYGDFTPTNDASRLFTVFYLLTGVGAVVASLGVIGARYLEIRDRRIRERLEKKNKQD